MRNFLIDTSDLDYPETNARQFMNALKIVDIPAILDPADIASYQDLDEKAVMLQVSEIYNFLQKHQPDLEKNFSV